MGRDPRGSLKSNSWLCTGLPNNPTVSLSVVPTLVGLCQTWGCEHSLGSLDREILTAGFQNPSAVWREDESVLRIGVVM